MLQALCLLSTLVTHEVRSQLWYSTSDLAMHAAAAGAFLMDLLDMRMMEYTEMSVGSAKRFYRSAPFFLF